MSDIAIKVQGVGKEYRVGKRELNKTLRETLMSFVSAPFRRDHKVEGEEGSERFWALKDVSFEVKRGEVIGIIGRNGAGKSTLLKILSRITDPTQGQVEIEGRVGSLLEVGTGFHPELTGRENVYLNGAILGMRRGEIQRKFDEIVAFSEVEKFLDTPVKHYSSGMYMRLAFAVAAHLEPEILIVDEVLAVGDSEFQKKCLGKIGEVAKEGRTVLFVSHNMGAIRSLCGRAILLNSGRVSVEGSPADVITKYLAAVTDQGVDGEVAWSGDTPAPGDQNICLRMIRMSPPSGQAQSSFEADKPITIDIHYEVLKPLRGARFNLHVMTVEGESAFSSTDHLHRSGVEKPGLYHSVCTIPGGLLNRRAYGIELSCDVAGVGILIPRAKYLSFVVSGKGNQASFFPENWPGIVCPNLSWRVEPLAQLPPIQSDSKVATESSSE